MKHKVGKSDIKLYKEFPSHEQPEEIEVDEFIKKIGEKEIRLDLVPIAPIEPCYSTSEADSEDIRRVFDSSSDSDNEPTQGNREYDDEPMIIVTIPGNGRMSEDEQNTERIVRVIDNEENMGHDSARRMSQSHVQTEVHADREVSESSYSSERTSQD